VSFAVEVMQAVIGEVEARIAFQERVVPPSYMMPGQDVYVPGIGDGQCSAIIATLTDAFATDNFPETAPRSCGSRQAFVFRFGVYRCFPTAEDFGGEEPSRDAINEASAELLADQDALYCGIRNGLAYAGFTHLLERYTPIGPQGGLAGGHWVVTVDALRE
jgi:hypothetical protein